MLRNCELKTLHFRCLNYMYMYNYLFCVSLTRHPSFLSIRCAYLLCSTFCFVCHFFCRFSLRFLLLLRWIFFCVCCLFVVFSHLHVVQRITFSFDVFGDYLVVFFFVLAALSLLFRSCRSVFCLLRRHLNCTSRARASFDGMCRETRKKCKYSKLSFSHLHALRWSARANPPTFNFLSRALNATDFNI